MRDWIEEEHFVVVGLVLRYAGTKALSCFFFFPRHIVRRLWTGRTSSLLLKGLRVGLEKDPGFCILYSVVCERKGCSG
jgi:hypothetical protein